MNTNNIFVVNCTKNGTCQIPSGIMCQQLDFDNIFTFNNIDYVLTTHYTKLCKKLNKQNNNLYMKVNTNAKDFEYTYKIKKGISKVKGAMKVLKDLNYPENIITNMKN